MWRSASSGPAGVVAVRYGSFDRKETLVDLTGLIAEVLAGRIVARVRNEFAIERRAERTAGARAAIKQRRVADARARMNERK